MAQFTLKDPVTIQKLKDDPVFRKKFATDLGVVFGNTGHLFDIPKLEDSISTQVKGVGANPAASTAIIITIF